MALITEEQIGQLKNLTNSDGKIMITENMPEDLKEAITFLNDNDIDIFKADGDKELSEDEMVVEDEIVEDLDGNSNDALLEELEPFDDEELKDEETEELGDFL